jgi:hypothetical protein
MQNMLFPQIIKRLNTMPSNPSQHSFWDIPRTPVMVRESSTIDKFHYYTECSIVIKILNKSNNVWMTKLIPTTDFSKGSIGIGKIFDHFTRVMSATEKDFINGGESAGADQIENVDGFGAWGRNGGKGGSGFERRKSGA